MNDQVTSAETTELLRLAEAALCADGDFVELGCYRGDTSVLLGKLLQKPIHANLQADGEDGHRAVHHISNPAFSGVSKSLWIYDSFAGLPEKTSEDSSGAGANFQKGELLVTKRQVIDKLKKHGIKVIRNPKTASAGNTDTANPLQPHNPEDSAQVSGVIVKKAWFDQLQATDLPDQIAFAFCDGDLYKSIQTSLELVAPRLSQRGIIIVHDYANPELPGATRAVDEFLQAHPDLHIRRRYSLAIITH